MEANADTRKLDATKPFAIISDVHANLEALQAVIAHIRSGQATKIICLGDLVGYGANPAECVDMVMENCEVCLLGNHDWALVNPTVGFNPEAAEAARTHRRWLAPWMPLMRARKKRWNFLTSLAKSFELPPLKFYHASPRDPIMEYVLPDDVQLGPSPKIQEIMEGLEAGCFVGHTHIPGVFTSDYSFLVPDEVKDGYPIAGRKALINVGSVGQPRDGDPRACYVLVAGESVYYHRVEYDVRKAAEKIRASAGLSVHFAERLLKGR